MPSYRIRKRIGRLWVWGCFSIAGAAVLKGQVLPAQIPLETAAVEENPAVNLPMERSSDPPMDFWSRVWISGQINSITQFHPAFHAGYSGENSAGASAELASSRVLTVFTGIRITRTTEILFDVESAGGSGLGSALGMAGFTNLDVVRNPTLGSKPYPARYLVRQIVGLGKETMEAPAGPLGLATRLPVRRLEFRLGKFSTADFLDVNSVGSDSHLQFMNWTVDNNGAYDYAADTRGYTYGALVEYYDRGWAVRFLEATMPTVANGLTLDWNLRRARAENVEWELDRGVLPKRPGVLRALAYLNHANMGSYREAIDDFLAGRTSERPDITETRQQGRLKYGFGLNAEQQLTAAVRGFVRWGWNEGHNESFAYTEVNQTVSGGVQWGGATWKRPDDRIGVAAVCNGISGDHRRYLELGGIGFLLGDGKLNYARERILEAYYNWNLGRGMSLSLDLQRVENPGYNRDRGPILVPSIRFHSDIDRKSFARKAN